MSNDLKAFLLSVGGLLAVAGSGLLVLWRSAEMPGMNQTNCHNCATSPS